MTRPKLPTLLIVLCALSSISVLQAAITISSTAPSLDSADQGNLTWSTTGSDSYWTDRPNPGQSFTTDSNSSGYTLNSFSFQLNSTRTASSTLSYNIRVVSLSGTDSTTITNLTGETWNGVHNSGDWITYTFDTPVSLAANTLYGVDIQHVSGGAWQDGITSLRRNGNTFAGGAKYTRGDGDPAVISNSSNDLIFHVDMTAALIPEPSVALLSGLGVMLLLRRRKH